MINFFKNFVSYLSEKKFFFFSGILILLILFLPLPALAQLAWLRDVFLFIPYLLVAVVLVVAILATQGIAFLMGAILDWVISPGFVSLSYTIPCAPPDYTGPAANCNPIIGLGLNITQHLVNLLLVVILVYIALSIALRIGENDAKKLLFRKLIIIALLVNFAPVLCGLIVDASNITMNYFLEPIRGGVAGILTQVAPFIDAVVKSIWGAGGEIASRMGVLALAGAMIVLNLGTALAFLLFAGLFIFRYVALWVLVILAPIAFVFWILPGTKKLWDMWWNNFIQWSIIGIPIAFFLYLALSSFSVLSKHFRANLEAPEIEAASVGIFNQIFPFFIVLVFLGLGFLIGLATSAMGAEAIIKGGKAAGMVAGKRMGKGAWRATKAVGRAVASPAREVATHYRVEKKFGGAGTLQAAGRATRMVAGAYWARRKDILPAIGRAPGAVWKGVKASPRAAQAVGKGTLSAIGDMAQAGLIAGVPGVAKALGIKKKKEKKKGFKKCPSCEERGVTTEVAASAKVCPVCGYDFEEFEPEPPQQPQQPRQPSP